MFWRVAKGDRIDSFAEGPVVPGTENGFQPPPSPSLARSFRELPLVR